MDKANQLAADVRLGVLGTLYDKADAALDELVALVGTLQQERDALENRWLDDNARAVAAEAALATTRQALADMEKRCTSQN